MTTTMALTALLSAVGVQAADKPLNVIFILADDLGYSDTTLYGTTNFYQTPNLQRLAGSGGRDNILPRRLCE